ncbi:MAG: hypothetical protein H5T98_10375 [Syntrophomonadaceae bacterium]|nr:hypothetical protein [Syntrophomonadaceae bacterium]
MKRIMIIILLLILILTIIGGCTTLKKEPLQVPNRENYNYQPPKYNPNISITYNKSYDDLKGELLYARITVRDDSIGRETIRLIKEKERLVDIVREFDKLKATVPKGPKPKVDEKTESMVVTMWREGSSVSYVLLKIDSAFYYRERPGIPLKEMPQNLVNLLELK